MISKEDRKQIKAFVENKPMLEAVGRVLLPDEPFAIGVDFDKDDAEYGRAVKAWVGAREIIEVRIADLLRIASSNPQPAPKNEAR